jgi:phospholipase D1/2
MGYQYKQRWHGNWDTPDQPEQRSGGRHSGYGQPEGRPGLKLKSCRAQVIRSVSDWSHGVLTEHSIQDACECLFALCIVFEVID